jgi:hypothetical protein
LKFGSSRSPEVQFRPLQLKTLNFSSGWTENLYKHFNTTLFRTRYRALPYGSWKVRYRYMYHACTLPHGTVPYRYSRTGSDYCTSVREHLGTGTERYHVRYIWRYDTVRYGTEQLGTVRYGTGTVPYRIEGTVPYRTVPVPYHLPF